MKEVSSLWQIALKGAKYLVENDGYDYDSCCMDEFLRALGCDVNDMEFMDWFYTNMSE